MDTDAIDDLIEQLRSDLDAEKRERERLRTDFDLLSSKLRTPGTKFLVDLEYRLIYSGTVSIPTLGPHDTLLETRKDGQDAIYEMSAKRTDTNGEGVIYFGAPVVAPPNAVLLCLDTRYATGPNRQETYLVAYNTKGSTVNVTVKVWRRIGM